MVHICLPLNSKNLSIYPTGGAVLYFSLLTGTHAFIRGEASPDIGTILSIHQLVQEEL